MDKQGETHAKVPSVVQSNERKPGRNDNLPSVGNTENVEKAAWAKSSGEPELIAVWQDPDFDKSESVFYYTRVMEIPTPRGQLPLSTPPSQQQWQWIYQ